VVVLVNLKGEEGNSVKVPSPLPRKRENGIVALIGDGEVQETVAVEVRDDYGSGIVSHREGRAGCFRE